MEEPMLTDKSVCPTEAVIFSSIGKAAPLWQAFFRGIREEHADLSEEWRYYNDGKRWLMKVLRKKKTICWVAVFKGSFRTTCYFTDKAEAAIYDSSLSDELKDQFRNGKRYNKIRGLTVNSGKKKDVEYARVLLGLKLAMK
jgi:hypothetical protein